MTGWDHYRPRDCRFRLGARADSRTARHRSLCLDAAVRPPMVRFIAALPLVAPTGSSGHVGAPWSLRVPLRELDQLGRPRHDWDREHVSAVADPSRVRAGFAIAISFATLGALRAQEFDLWAELGKAGVQLGVIVLGGAALTTIVRAFEAERENRLKALEAERDNRRRRNEKLRGDLLTAYDDLKSIRRTLRTSGFSSPSGVLSAEQAAEFAKQMRALADVDLSLQRIHREIQTDPDQFPNPEPLMGPFSNSSTTSTRWSWSGERTKRRSQLAPTRAR